MGRIHRDTLRRLRVVLGTSLALVLVACGGDGSASSQDPGSSAASTTGSATATGSSTTTSSATLSIQGAPPAGVNYGSPYNFTPTVSGAAGATLTFSIQNKPAWATFSSTNGALSGTPAAGDVGTDADVVISVSDGTSSASLKAFSISVNETSPGSVTLDWTAVTETTTDTTLTGLAGYIVYYGTSADNLNQQVKLANPGQTTYVVTNLAAATWYFAVAAYTSDGVIGTRSNVGQKTIP
jgi:hypothetical protein